MTIPLAQFRYDGKKGLKLAKLETEIHDLYASESEYAQMLAESQREMAEVVSMMAAHNRYGFLVVVQAMDAAGKDGTIRHVMSGVSPADVRVETFKRPTSTELDHDYLWRHQLVLPQRGHLTLFNRSYYEEVLAVRIHPEWLTTSQRLPEERTHPLKKVWKQRYEDIANFEKYLHRNGIRVLKFFLNVSKKEQGKRLVERIEDPSKNWKFEEQDIHEREHWDAYQQAYEDAINATATKAAPWYVIPADDKKNMRLVVGRVIASELKKLKMSYPSSSPERQAQLKKFIAVIRQQDESSK